VCDGETPSCKAKAKIEAVADQFAMPIEDPE